MPSRTRHPALASIIGVALIAAPLVAQAQGFRLSSPTIKRNSTLSERHVLNGFGCDGQNLSPALQWSGAPRSTKSFALTVYDPDAPTGSGWWHWVVYNLPPTTTALPEGAGSLDGKGLPAGAVQGRTDFGAPAFGGACPPKGDRPHRYVFTLYALKVEKIDVPPDASAAMVGFNIQDSKIAEASFTAVYARK